jgi:hypothetical protein
MAPRTVKAANTNAVLCVGIDTRPQQQRAIAGTTEGNGFAVGRIQNLAKSFDVFRRIIAAVEGQVVSLQSEPDCFRLEFENAGCPGSSLSGRLQTTSV